MAKVIVNRAQIERLLPTSQDVEEGLEKRAQKVLRRLRETAPNDTGALADSLRIETRMERGKKVVRIVSDDPQIRDILKGTKGPYQNVPPFGPGSSLGAWASRHGFTSNKSRYMLARHIAVHGTKPAGTFNGRASWIKEAIREINR